MSQGIINNNADAQQTRIHSLVARARAAQREIEGYDQAQIDLLVAAAGWAVIAEPNNQALAQRAVQDTGLGNIADKISKNHRKTLGLLGDLQNVKSIGIIAEDPARGIIEIARPVGVVAAITPSTNPVATVINNILNALKCGNAIIIAPSPAGASSCALLLEYIHNELDILAAPRDLVQMLPLPINRESTAQLMREADLVVATGSQANIRAAIKSGTPVFGVGAGNVASMISETADIEAAAQKIARSKTFDNATSCSSENSVVIPESRYSSLVSALVGHGGVLLTAEEKQRLQRVLWHDGKLSRSIVGRPASFIARAAGFERAACHTARFFMVQEQGIGADYPFSGEKLSPVLTLYQVRDFADACDTVRKLYSWQGAGHSVGLHGNDPQEALRAGLTLPVCRVMINQTHCFAAGGNVDNGLPFSLSLGCGSWGGNLFSDNLTWRHFSNTVRISQPVAAKSPDPERIFGDYFHRRNRA
ncbi:TPA: aldehyde dehydrogenase family protein [Raoultella planticola]